MGSQLQSTWRESHFARGDLESPAGGDAASLGRAASCLQTPKEVGMTKTHSGWVTFAGVMLFIVGVLQLFGAFSLWAGGVYGRFVAILAASLSAFAALMSIPAYPFWSLAIFAIDIIVIYQVATYGGAGYEDEPTPEARHSARRDVVT